MSCKVSIPQAVIFVRAAKVNSNLDMQRVARTDCLMSSNKYPHKLMPLLTGMQ